MCRAPTPLTKDVSGEYPLSIFPSLYYPRLFPSLGSVSFSATPALTVTFGTSSVLPGPSLPVISV